MSKRDKVLRAYWGGCHTVDEAAAATGIARESVVTATAWLLGKGCLRRRTRLGAGNIIIWQRMLPRRTKRKRKLQQGQKSSAQSPKRAWWPPFGCGDGGTDSRLRFIAWAGGPDSTNLGSSLQDFCEYGFGAPSSALLPLSMAARAVRSGGRTLREYYD